MYLKRILELFILIHSYFLILPRGHFSPQIKLQTIHFSSCSNRNITAPQCFGSAHIIPCVRRTFALVKRMCCLFKRSSWTCIVIVNSGRQGIAWLQQTHLWPQKSGYESDLLIRGIELCCLRDRQCTNEPPPCSSAPAGGKRLSHYWESLFEMQCSDT